MVLQGGAGKGQENLGRTTLAGTEVPAGARLLAACGK